MRIVIPDDYQDCVRTLECFARLIDHQVTVFNDTAADEDELARRFANAEALVLTRERTRIGAGLLDRLPALRIISQTGKIAGHVDVDACTARGVVVVDGSGTATATAELTWLLILASRRHLIAEVERMRDGRWQGFLGQQLQGQRLGIYGYGRIGRQVARYGAAFGMPVWAWGRDGSRAAAQADGVDVAPSRDAFFAECDVISLHVRLLPETRGLIGPGDLGRMKPQALLVNTSRAELIAPGVLEQALQAGRPGHAAIDVYEREPVLDPRHPLLRMPNVLCTPHIGYVERQNYERYFGTAFDNLLDFAAGNPRNVVNPEVLDRLR